MFPYRQSEDGCPLCVVCGAELFRMDGLPRHAGARYCSGRCHKRASAELADRRASQIEEAEPGQISLPFA